MEVRKEMKRLALITCMVACISLFSGCSDGGDASQTVVDAQEVTTSESGSSAVTESESDVTEAALTQEPLEQKPEEKDKETILKEYFANYTTVERPEKKESHYQYNMKAISNFARESGHDNIEVYWDDFLDAVSEGRTSFLCPDLETYRYIQIEMIMWFLPGADEWIVMPNRPKIVDGMASFSYAISDEERLAKLEQIKTVTESVLNEVLDDDYTDFEKAMALYLYFVDNFTYYEDMEHWGGILSTLIRKYGICDEFSRAYSYLLVQAGVEDAGTVSDNGHRWSFVKLGDYYYHVDTTWGLGNPNLSYFLLSTSQRIYTTGDPLENLYIDLMKEHEYCEQDFPDEDEYFSAFWAYGSEVKWDRDEKMIYVRYMDDRGRWRIKEVSYEGL